MEQRGLRVYGISVDSPQQNQAMIEKLILPFSLLSDPDGQQAITRYGLWDEQGQISRPGLVLVDAAGAVRFLYEGRDFADRPKDDVVLKGLEPDGPGR